MLPYTQDEAEFDTGAMAWMDTAEGYAPVITTETRTFDFNGDGLVSAAETGVACQVLTGYKHLPPSAGHKTVVSGDFTENVTVKVRSMKNGDTVQPVFSAMIEYNIWEGACSTHSTVEEKTPDRWC